MELKICDNYNEFKAHTNKDQLIIGMITASWCPPCKMTKEFLNTMNASQETNLRLMLNNAVNKYKTSIVFAYMDVDDQQWNGLYPEVKSIPVFFMQKNDKVYKKPGAIRSMIEFNNLLDEGYSVVTR